MIHGILAEFKNPHDLLEAARKVRDAGYRSFDCHSPFPIHGMDEAMGLKRSKLGFIVAIFAILGGLTGLTLQGWVHSYAYPLTISGKPLFAWQAYIIIIFALFVLFGAISAVVGMLALNKLPRFHHPLFYSDTFKKVTRDGFFISIGADDPQFSQKGTKDFLHDIGSAQVELVEGDDGE
ncbi:MAG: DUF3341 domain-containing protein [Fidelibacterota bacterium]